MLSYMAYGLQIASEFLLPELTPHPGTHPDVYIQIGSGSAEVPRSCCTDARLPKQSRPFILTVPSVARYLIVNGKRIWIEPDADSTEANVRLFLLGSALGALLLQRGLLPLHASAIQTANGAALFVGPSGRGKSTLAAALAQRGYAMLSDDVAALDVDDAGQVVAFPSMPYMRLWADAAAQLQRPTEGQRRVQPSLDKYLLPVARFCAEPLPVRAIYALHVGQSPDIRLQPVDYQQRFEILANNTYRAEFLAGLGVLQTHFRLVATVANRVPVYRMTRPNHPFLLDALVDRIEAELA